MHQSSPQDVELNELLERYVFKITDHLIDQLQPEQQNQLLELYIALGKSSHLPNPIQPARLDTKQG